MMRNKRIPFYRAYGIVLLLVFLFMLAQSCRSTLQQPAPTKLFTIDHIDGCEPGNYVLGRYTSVQFSGSCHNGNAEGEGKAVWLLDTEPLMEYQGGFADDLMHGKGKVLVYNGSFTVEGEWEQGYPVQCTASTYPPIETTLSVPDDSGDGIEREVKFNLYKMQPYVKYPEIAKRQKIEGAVVARVLVTEKGEISRIAIAESVSPILVMPTINAIFQSKPVEAPAIKGGKPIPVWLTVPVMFKLR